MATLSSERKAVRRRKSFCLRDRGGSLLALLAILLLLDSSPIGICGGGCGVVVANAEKHKTRSLPRVNDPKEAWEQIKMRSVEELQRILKEFDVDGYDDEEELSKEELQELAYDEDVMERWFERYPEEITKYKPTPPIPPKKTPPIPPKKKTISLGNVPPKIDDGGEEEEEEVGSNEL